MKIVSVLILALLSLGFVGCAVERSASRAEEYFKGDHLLNKMSLSLNGSNYYEGYLVFFGKDKPSAEVSVKFSWNMNGTNVFSTLPLEKIRIVSDPSAEVPMIKFRWQRYDQSGPIDIQDLFNRYVLYAVVTARPQDLPVKIEFPIGL